VYACERVPIAPHDTAGELRARLVDVGTRLLLERLPSITSATPQPQAGDATYAEKLGVEEFRLDVNNSAADLARVVRAGNPRPGAFFVVNDKRVKVWRAHEGNGDLAPGEVSRQGELGTAHGVLVLDEVQPEGKRPMDGRAWAAGLRR
jgi:methionyl-tRNA formyltransferase